jgi:hypothetical protein
MMCDEFMREARNALARSVVVAAVAIVLFVGWCVAGVGLQWGGQP